MGSLNQHRGGAGEGLVLLHGIGSSWRAWLPVLGALEDRHDVLAVDLPGFGDSPPLERGVPPTVAALADAVEAEIEASELGRPHVGGNSLGGWVALELARRGRARSVIALSPAGMWTPREAVYSRAMLRVMYAAVRRIRPHAKRLTRSTAGRTALLSTVSSRPWQIEANQACYAVEALAGADSFVETLEASITGRPEGLGEIDVPVTIGWGSRDRLLLPRQGPRFVRAIPGAVLRPLPGAGHVPMWDDRRLVAEAILEHIARASHWSWGGSRWPRRRKSPA